MESIWLKKILTGLAVLVMTCGCGFALGSELPQKRDLCQACYVDSAKKEAALQTQKRKRVQVQGGGDVKIIECFHCDKRPCVATKEAWLQLWHKYWGTNEKAGLPSNSIGEERK